jgi:O-antigen ligase
MTTSAVRLAAHAILVGTVCVLGWGVLAVASVYPWGYRPLMAGAAALGLAGIALPVRGCPRWGAVPIALIVVGVCISAQLVPLPAAWLTALSPAADRFLQQFNLDYAAIRMAAGTRHSLSIAPQSTELALSLFGAFALLMLGASRALSMVGARVFVRLLIALGVIVAIVGLAERATFNGKLLWFWPYRFEHRPFGPFINKNNYAGWMMMVLSVALGHLAGLVVRHRGLDTTDWRSRILWFESPDGREALVVGGATLTMALAQVLTMSRAGMICLVVIVTMTGWWAMQRGGGVARRVAVIAAPLSMIAALLAWVGPDTVLARFADRTGATMEGRFGAWADAWTIIKDFPLTGVGINGFERAMQLYQQHDSESFWSAAHNDFIQLAAEGGLLVGVPIAVALVAVLVAIRRRVHEDSPDRSGYWCRAGAVTALVAIGLQETVEFSLQIPANAALFAAVLAVALFAPRMQQRGVPGVRSAR